MHTEQAIEKDCNSKKLCDKLSKSLFMTMKLLRALKVFRDNINQTNFSELLAIVINVYRVRKEPYHRL